MAALNVCYLHEEAWTDDGSAGPQGVKQGCSECAKEKAKTAEAQALRDKIADMDRIIALKDALISQLQGTIDELREDLDDDDRGEM
jgi:hypothetical protein